MDTAEIIRAEKEEKALKLKVKELQSEVLKLATVVKAMKKRLDRFEPTKVERLMDSFSSRVKTVDEIIKVSVLRSTVATELSFMARGAGDPERGFINSDVIFALDLPPSFWEENYCDERTILEWIALIRAARLGSSKKAA